ncbi:MAG: DUF1499 domain-containing protein [Cycloclasticus sp.]
MHAIFFIFILLMSSSSFSAPTDLKACPNKPNCVSSKSSDEHAITPFTLSNGATLNMQQLVVLVSSIDARASVIHDEQTLHAEFTSRVFGFVDDLDLILDTNTATLHVRSASRTGYYDFGVNRRRVEKLRSLLTEQGIIQ